MCDEEYHRADADAGWPGVAQITQKAIAPDLGLSAERERQGYGMHRNEVGDTGEVAVCEVAHTWSMSDWAVARPNPEDAPVMITVLPYLPGVLFLSKKPACTLTDARDAEVCMGCCARSAQVLETEERMLRRAASGAAALEAIATRPAGGARVARVAGRVATAGENEAARVCMSERG